MTPHTSKVKEILQMSFVEAKFKSIIYNSVTNQKIINLGTAEILFSMEFIFKVGMDFKNKNFKVIPKGKDSIKINLPEVDFVDVIPLTGYKKTYFEVNKLFSRINLKSKKELEKLAEEDAKKKAKESEIFSIAEYKAKESIYNLFKILGYKSIEIEIVESTKINNNITEKLGVQNGKYIDNISN
jgi:hypothetical protein